MVKFESHKTALIAVNMQERLMEEAKAAGIDADDLAARIGTYVGKMRAAGVLIVMAVSGGGGKLDPRLGYCPETDYFIEKPCFSAFFETDLRYVLMNHKVDHALVCGLKTNLDCRATAIDATSHDLISYILSDLTAADSEEIKAFHLREMSWYFSMPITAEEAMTRLNSGRF